MAQFDETRFPRDIQLGFVGGPRFFTTVVAAAGGAEQRNQNWAVARPFYQAAHELKDQADLDALVAFFYARRGKLVGFRFTDWMDYCSDMVGLRNNMPATEDTLPGAGVLTAQALGTGASINRTDITLNAVAGTLTTVAGDFTGNFVAGISVIMSGWSEGANNTTKTIESVTSTVMTFTDNTGLVNDGPGDNVTITANGFQLKKTYDAGPGTDYVRNIYKPVSGAVRAYIAAVEETHVTVTITTGWVEFDAGYEPSDGDALTVDFLYDVPVRFDVDEFGASLEHFNLYDWQSITLVGVREL